jgi:hypothetical protein
MTSGVAVGWCGLRPYRHFWVSPLELDLQRETLWLQPTCPSPLPKLLLLLCLNRGPFHGHYELSESYGCQGPQELQLVGVTLEPCPLSEEDFFEELTLSQSPVGSLQLAPVTNAAVTIALDQYKNIQ